MRTMRPLLRMKAPSFAIAPALLVVLCLAVPVFRAQASLPKKNTLGFRCVDILEGLGRVKQADPARSFASALEILSAASVVAKYPRLNRVRDILVSLPNGHRSLKKGTVVLVADDTDGTPSLAQAMAAQDISSRLGSIPGGALSFFGIGWWTRVRLAVFMRRFSEYISCERFDLASVFEEFGRQIERGLNEGDFYVEGFEYGNWQVEFILIRLNGVDTYMALKLPRL